MDVPYELVVCTSFFLVLYISLPPSSNLFPSPPSVPLFSTTSVCDVLFYASKLNRTIIRLDLTSIHEVLLLWLTSPQEKERAKEGTSNVSYKLSYSIHSFTTNSVEWLGNIAPKKTITGIDKTIKEENYYGARIDKKTRDDVKSDKQITKVIKESKSETIWKVDKNWSRRKKINRIWERTNQKLKIARGRYKTLVLIKISGNIIFQK